MVVNMLGPNQPIENNMKEYQSWSDGARATPEQELKEGPIDPVADRAIQSLQRSIDLIRQRGTEYGDTRENFKRIAGGWSLILGCRVTVEQVPLMLDWMKTSRLCATPHHTDSWEDKAGYSALGGGVASAPEKY